MDRNTYFRYNALVGEINPLHFDEDYARKIGFKDIVVAGVYTFSFIPKMVTDRTGQPGKIRSIELRYENPVYIGEEVVYRGRPVGEYVSEGVKFVEYGIEAENVGGTRLISATVTVECSGPEFPAGGARVNCEEGEKK